MAIRQKMQVTMRLDGKSASHARTDVSVRDHTVLIDEPAPRGGTDKGASPTETMLASLAGCTNVITHKIAHAKGVEIAALDIGLDVDFDRRGVTLSEEIAVPFTRIGMTIDIATDASDEQIEAIKADLARFCPVSKVFREAGTVIDETWNVRKP